VRTPSPGGVARLPVHRGEQRLVGALHDGRQVHQQQRPSPRPGAPHGPMAPIVSRKRAGTPKRPPSSPPDDAADSFHLGQQSAVGKQLWLFPHRPWDCEFWQILAFSTLAFPKGGELSKFIACCHAAHH
jgi:hypothetical protein